VLRRAYEESPSCAGNRTATQEGIDDEEFCEYLYLYSISDSDTDSAVCRLVKTARDCHSFYVGRLCGNLFKWLIDRFWLARAEVYYPQCVSDLESDQTPLPPSPASVTVD
ncbi:hypothetical protein EGW08_023294, partial [Elysia chlorotica]